MGRALRWFSWVIGSLGCLLFLFIVALVHRYSKNHFNRCDMTFMYRYPKFIDIEMTKSVQQAFPNYALILYGEGDYAEQSKSLKLTGNPVLFIPGNAGSAKQVRSLGSMMQLKTESGSASSVGLFNVFAVDYDDEVCGLYGGYLVRQTLFLAEAIKRIFSLYDHLPTLQRPKQIILVGHSMGGLVARAVLTLSSFDRQSVAVLITLSSPHIAAPVLFDSELIRFREAINGHWEHEANTSLSHLTVVSVAGGSQDLLVPSYLTKWPAAFHQPNGMHLIEQVSANTDFVWAEADHLCIVWCNQLVRVIARSLFDMLDRNTMMLSSSPSWQYETIKWHFERNGGAKSVHEANAMVDSVTGLRHFEDNRKSKDFTADLLQIYTTGSKSIAVVLYKLFVDASLINQSVFLLTTQEVSSVAFECDAERLECDRARPIGDHRLLPPSSRYIHIKLTDRWLGRTLVVPTVHHSPKRALVFKRYSDDDSTHVGEVHLSLLDPFKSWNIINEDISGTVAFRNITLNGFTSIAQVYIVRLVPMVCKEKSYANISAVRLSIWKDEASSLVRHFGFPYNSEDDLVMYLQSSTFEHFPVLQLFLDPACQYRLSIQPTFVGSLFEVVRQFSFILPSIISVHILILCFLRELNDLYFHSSHWLVVKWQLLLVIFQYFTASFSRFHAADFLTSALLIFVAVSSVFFGLLCSFAIRWVANFITRKLTRVTLRIGKNRFSSFLNTWGKTIGICLAVLTTCGVNGIIVLIIFLISRLFQRKNYITCQESLTSVENILVLVHLLACVLVGPSGLVWAKDLIKHGILSLGYDPSFHAAVAFLIALSLPIPQWLASVRPFILLVAAVYISFADNLLPSIAACLAAVVGCYMNSAIVPVVDTAKKDKSA